MNNLSRFCRDRGVGGQGNYQLLPFFATLPLFPISSCGYQTSEQTSLLNQQKFDLFSPSVSPVIFALLPF